MKIFISFLILLSFSSLAVASVDTKICDLKKNKWRKKMELVTANMTNINTTRTPEGGPYQRQDLDCDQNDVCQVIKIPLFSSKHEPGHIDADENGNVKYPATNMLMEMTDMIGATRAYEDVVDLCKEAK